MYTLGTRHSNLQRPPSQSGTLAVSASAALHDYYSPYVKPHLHPSIHLQALTRRLQDIFAITSQYHYVNISTGSEVRLEPRCQT